MNHRAFLIVLALLFAACDSVDPTSEPGAEVIPLEVGATWTLERAFEVNFEDGAAIDTVYHDNRPTITLTVTRDTLIGATRWFQIEASPHGGLGHPAFTRASEWYGHQEDGLYRLASLGATPELIYATAAASGTPFIDTETEAVVLLDPNATIDLASMGVIHARQYERTQRHFSGAGIVPPGPITPPLHLTDYLSADVGFVALAVPFYKEGMEPGTWAASTVQHYELVSFERP